MLVSLESSTADCAAVVAVVLVVWDCDAVELAAVVAVELVALTAMVPAMPTKAVALATAAASRDRLAGCLARTTGRRGGSGEGDGMSAMAVILGPPPVRTLSERSGPAKDPASPRSPHTSTVSSAASSSSGS